MKKKKDKSLSWLIPISKEAKKHGFVWDEKNKTLSKHGITWGLDGGIKIKIT